jgi:hypothetical protein
MDHVGAWRPMIREKYRRWDDKELIVWLYEGLRLAGTLGKATDWCCSSKKHHCCCRCGALWPCGPSPALCAELPTGYTAKGLTEHIVARSASEGARCWGP